MAIIASGKLKLLAMKNAWRILALIIFLIFGHQAWKIYAQAIGMNPPCEMDFGFADGIGCPGGDCVSASEAKLTAKSKCESSGGICPISSDTLKGAKRFVGIFDTLSQGNCTLIVSSAVQTLKEVSSSTCHRLGFKRTGTCIDFNIEPATDTCFNNFYKAAKASKAVRSYTNEYKPLCYQTTQTGGNIHTNFTKNPKEETIEPVEPITNDCDRDCIMECAQRNNEAFFGTEVIVQDDACLAECTAMVETCMADMLEKTK